MAQRDTDRKEPLKRGPDPDRLKIDDDPEEALQKLFETSPLKTKRREKVFDELPDDVQGEVKRLARRQLIEEDS